VPLREWIKLWLALKVDIATTTDAECARRRVNAWLGDLQVAEMSRLAPPPLEGGAAARANGGRGA
jgi:hypothetical protein